MATQSAVLPSARVAVGVSSAMDRGVILADCVGATALRSRKMTKDTQCALPITAGLMRSVFHKPLFFTRRREIIAAMEAQITKRRRQ
jgi:hypothetical protein